MYDIYGGLSYGEYSGKCCCYGHIRKIRTDFIIQNQTYHTGSGSTDLENAAINLPDSGEFRISWNTAVYGAVLFIVLF